MSWQQGVDISNFTTLDQYTADFLHGYFDFVCIGLQDTTKARDFRDMIIGDGVDAPLIEWYVERRGRSLELTVPGQWIWIDIEKGAFEDAQQVRDQGTENTRAGLNTLIYCNQTSLAPVFGDSTELADYGCGLIYASYVPPLPQNWQPFNGWRNWTEWQCSSMGIRINRGQGSVEINCDLIVRHLV